MALVHTLTVGLIACAASAVAKPYSVWMADSIIARNEANGRSPSTGKPEVTYENGHVWQGLWEVYEQTRDEKYFNWIKNGLDNNIAPNGTISGITNYKLEDWVLDSIRIGPSALDIFQKTKDQRYKKGADALRYQLQLQPRTTEGQFWHKAWYQNQGWLDGVYMADVFYAKYTAAFQAGNWTAWSDILKQYTLMAVHTLDYSTGLYYHGYDNSHTTVWSQNDRGHAPEVWDRAVGWYAMSIVDALDYWPVWEGGRYVLISQLNLLALALKKSQTKEGGWWLVMSQPGREGNYIESSGTAMFVHALLKGIRKGYLPKGLYYDTAKKGYQYLLDNFITYESDGTIGMTGTVSVGSLSGNATFEYYISQTRPKNDRKGTGSFIRASLEYELSL